jgi:Ca2+-binding EF-hand superfamily protein
LLLHYNGRLFKTTIDQNSDGYLSEAELSALVIGITDDAIAELMKDFDASRDGQVDVKEFVEGISRWLKKLRRSATSGDSQDDQSIRILDHFHQVYILLHIISSSHACLCLCDESL